MGLKKYNEITPSKQRSFKVVGIALNEAIEEKRHMLYTSFVKQYKIVDPILVQVFLGQVNFTIVGLFLFFILF